MLFISQHGSAHHTELPHAYFVASVQDYAGDVVSETLRRPSLFQTSVTTYGTSEMTLSMYASDHVED
jgi:hypothetical protein